MQVHVDISLVFMLLSTFIHFSFGSILHFQSLMKSMLCHLVMAICFADFTLTLRIVDQSRTAGISVTFFANNTALLPCVRSSGDFISLHNVVVQPTTSNVRLSHPMAFLSLQLCTYVLPFCMLVCAILFPRF